LGKRIFTIAPGAPFLKTFAAALVEGRIVEGYSARLGPLELSDATIYVPTRRAARALASELARAIGRPTMLLPRILPLGALEEMETGLLMDEAGPESDYNPALAEAAGEIERRMRLTELTLTWARNLSHAIVSVDERGRYECDERESFLVATSAADAWNLSEELARLIDELIIEDVAWDRLDPRALPELLPELDSYWCITLDFLTIAIKGWPKILAERGLVDKARRQVALIDAQCRRLEEGVFAGPIVAIGSTGTNRATARLLAAIARVPNGAIVLPGLDLDLDARAWSMIAGDRKRNIEASFTHPQSGLSRLLGILNVRRDEVLSLCAGAPDLAKRGKFVSEALRPAEATDGWTFYREAVDAREIGAALEGVCLIEAADEREEALALAIAMRHALETPCETAALVTPDRKLARRVRAELQRWGVDAEDSAGEPLSVRPIGALARLFIDCAKSKMAAADLAALFAHPLFRLGFSRDDIAHLGALIEIGLLRSSYATGGLAARILDDCSSLIAAVKEESNGSHAHPAKKHISDEEWARIEGLLARLATLFSPLMATNCNQGLEQWVAAHRVAVEKATECADDDVDNEGDEALDALFDELAHNASEKFGFDINAYGHFFAGIAREVILREVRHADSRLQILGLLEARLIDADIVLLGGLDETVWPPQPRTDAFLNRPMRAALGLSPPERKLGQTAHDLAQAMGKRKVILSRACKRDGTPMVASRFLQRMAALGGEAWKACRARGDFYLRLARQIDRPPPHLLPSERPLPKPPLSLRPTRLSVTQIETLRRDPYAIYAEKILQLKELDPLGGPIGAAEKGVAIHMALARYVEKYPAGPLPPEADAELCALLRKTFAAQLQDAAFAVLQWPRLQKMIAFYLGFEGRRRDNIAAIKTERSGVLAIPLADGSVFGLTARADRIELNKDGSVTLVDYKTGEVPPKNEILDGFAPQLTLEAAMALRGAFDLGSRCETAEALYLKLGGPEGGKEVSLDFARNNASFMDAVDAHYKGLIKLLNKFRDEATAYPPRPFPELAKRYNAYDHLARVKEWSRGGEAEEGGA
jgi:ATP-dependent helicase/nuclease subunit B